MTQCACEVVGELCVGGGGIDGKVRQRDDAPAPLLEEKVPKLRASCLAARGCEVLRTVHLHRGLLPAVLLALGQRNVDAEQAVIGQLGLGLG